MIRNTFQHLALILFWIYLAVFPGSTIVVALDRVPGWGAWMGGALLLLQGGAALCWLVGRHGARGGLAALLVFLLAWAVEHAGVISGVPFGHYHYTGALQPQLLDTVPLAIPCAWLMVATGAWQLATTKNQEPRTGEPPRGYPTKNKEQRTKNKEQPRTKNQEPRTEEPEPALSNVEGTWRTTNNRRRTANWLDADERGRTRTMGKEQPKIYNLQSAICNLLVAATLVLLLDLQIETVATRINQYWIWQDGGPYYGVPTANFVAWWLIGLVMAVVVATVLDREGDGETGDRSQEPGSLVSRLTSHVSRQLPAYLYLLSTLMFTIVNLARGYTLAGAVGVLVLLVVFQKTPSHLCKTSNVI